MLLLFCDFQFRSKTNVTLRQQRGHGQQIINVQRGCADRFSVFTLVRSFWNDESVVKATLKLFGINGQTEITILKSKQGMEIAGGVRCSS